MTNSPIGALLARLPLPPALRRRLETVSGEGAVYLGNAGMAFVIRMTGAAIAFGLQVLLARLLSLTDYGLYVTFWTWLFVAAQIAALGFNDSCLRFLPRYLARGRFDDAQAFLRTGYRVVVAASVAIAALGLTIAWSLPDLATPGGERLVLLSLCLIGIPFLACELYLEGIARSFGWFVLSAAPAYVLRPMVLAIAVAALAIGGLELDASAALGAAIAVTATITIGQALVLRQRIRRQIGARAGTARRRGRKSRLWLAATLPLTIIYGIEEIYLVSDILLLGLLADPADVGIYFAAVRLMTLAGYVYYAFALISSREFSLARASRSHDELQRRVLRGTWWAFWLTVPTVLVMLALGYPLLAMFGPDYVSGYGVLVVLGLGLLARASVGQAGDLLIVLGHQKDGLFVASLSLAINALLTVALVPLLGVLGAAIGTACSQAVRAAALAYFVRRRARLEVFAFAGSGHPAGSAFQGSTLS
jgi:O-antigen/teichoic acid export membrane protein